MPSTTDAKVIPQLLFGIDRQTAVASLAITVAFSLVCKLSLIRNEAFQVLALTLGSIIAVAIVAGILICIPDFANGRRRSRHRGRGRGRHRTRHGHNNNQNRRSSRSRERLNQSEYSSSSTVKSNSSDSTGSSRRKAPSMPPLPIQPRNGSVNFKTTPGRVPVSRPSAQRPNSQRRYSSPPCLPSQASLSQYCLNPIVERKLEDLDYDDYWWRELDSCTQYYALILGYTQVTWDNDTDIEELPCEDWEWDEMTKEQKAAAQHFGYDRESWSE